MQFPSERRAALSDETAVAPRVLQLVPQDCDASTARTLVHLSDSLARSGGGMVAAGGHPRIEPALRRAGIDHRPFRPERPGIFQSSATQALLDTIAQRDLQVLHVHGTDEDHAAKALAEAANVPLVMSLTALPQTQRFIGRRQSRRGLTGRPVIAPSDYAATSLMRDFRLSPAAVEVVPPGIDPEALAEATISSERTIALTLAWGIGDDARDVFLIPVATTDPVWLNWILSCAGHGDAPDAVWVLIGPPGEAETAAAMNERIARAGLAGRMRWVPGCPDWAAAYKLSSLVLSLPARRMALHAHALEAQAMGRNVVIADSGAGPEALIPGKTGWLIRDRDAGSLIYAVSAAMARERIIRDAMAMSARNFVATRFSVRAMQAATQQIYAQVLERRRHA